ncbi:MAG: hypothetical protein JWP94_1634 [Mucilaginibacter sp.]|nr:hypothetical protein [Mucilaginibacter sp.]
MADLDINLNYPAVLFQCIIRHFNNKNKFVLFFLNKVLI